MDGKLMDNWGRVIWWLLHDDKGPTIVQTITFVGQAVLTLISLVIAICAPLHQQKVTKQMEEQKRLDDISKLRTALREEVWMYSQQCETAFASFRRMGPPLPRSGSLPPLTVFDANASKLGWLTRKEITSIIAFSSTLADIRYLVSDPARNGQMRDEDRSNITGMLRNACQYAADFLEAVGAFEDKSEHSAYITRLRETKYLD